MRIQHCEPTGVLPPVGPLHALQALHAVHEHVHTHVHVHDMWYMQYMQYMQYMHYVHYVHYMPAGLKRGPAFPIDGGITSDALGDLEAWVPPEPRKASEAAWAPPRLPGGPLKGAPQSAGPSPPTDRRGWTCNACHAPYNACNACNRQARASCTM